MITRLIDDVQILGPTSISYENDIMTITLPEAVSREVVDKFLDVAFSGVAITNAEDIIQIYGKKLTFDCPNYDFFYEILSGINKLGKITVKSATITKNEFLFEMIFDAGRLPLNATELDKIQEIVNPAIKNHDSIRIIGSDDPIVHKHVYTCRIQF